MEKFDFAITEDDEEATHILYPNSILDDAYCRPVFKKGEKCLVHFYRFPESLDNWGTVYPPEDKEPLEFGEDVEREEMYRVDVSWLLEMTEYNELLCEEDYEVDEKGQAVKHELLLSYDEFSNCEEKPKKKTKKRGRSPSPSPNSKSRKGKS